MKFSIFNFQFSKKREEGMALIVALIATSVLLIVVASVATLSVRQSALTSAGRDSQAAFYAADSGIECALYWDVKNPSGISAFATSTGTTINCNGIDMIVGGSSQSQFILNLTPDPYCALVVITKDNDGTTVIESKGYNTCNPASPRRLERAVRVTY